MIKAVFFDVDGTLVSHKTKSVPQSAVEAVNALRNKGIKVYLSTGRHMRELRQMPTQNMEFDGYIIMNGQMGLDQHKNVIFSNPFEEQDRAGLVEIFQRKEYPMSLVNEEGHYMNFVNQLVENALSGVSTAVPPVNKYVG